MGQEMTMAKVAGRPVQDMAVDQKSKREDNSQGRTKDLEQVRLGGREGQKGNVRMLWMAFSKHDQPQFSLRLDLFCTYLDTLRWPLKELIRGRKMRVVMGGEGKVEPGVCSSSLATSSCWVVNHHWFGLITVGWKN